jgi:hypothetical protein
MTASGRAVLALGGLIALWAGGCRDPMGRQKVSGTVLFKGQPLDQGNIMFFPRFPTGTQSGTAVKDGKYEITKARGLVPGEYRVMILSEIFFDQGGQDAPTDRPKGKVSTGERINPKYNVNSTLTAEVAPGADNVIDFAVD